MESFNYISNNKRISFFFILFLNTLIFNEVNSYLEFPIDYLPNSNYIFLKDNDNLDSKEKEEFMKQLFFKHLVTRFEIGTPTKSQMMIINSDSNEYYLDTLTPPETIQQQCKVSEFFKFDKKEYFDENSSNSYSSPECQTKKHEYHDCDEICNAKEKIKFTIDGKSETKEFPITIMKNHDEMVPGLIGLTINSTLAYKGSLLSELKRENLIKDYYWFIDFDKFSPLEKKIKGKFIIGDLPHNIYPEKYNKDLYKHTTSYRDSSSWTINMEKIFVENKTEEYRLDSKHVILFYEFYPAIGSNEFYNKIREEFMDQLVSEKKCFTGTFSQNIYSYDDLLFYYCDKSAKDILYENLPSINFESKDLKYTFQLTKEELFYSKGNYIYFMILFLPNQYNTWVLGQIFTSKYHFVFHTDFRYIGFYPTINISKDEKEEIIIKKTHAKIAILTIALAFTVIGIIIGIIIGAKFWSNKIRDKKATELIDDDYEYTPNENKINE